MSNNVKNNDSISKTLIVVILLCLICSVIVSWAAVGLKPRQQEQRLLDTQRNILDVAGLLQPNMNPTSVNTVFSARITPRLLDLKSGDFVDTEADTFDRAQALRDDEKSLSLTGKEDIAHIKRRANLVEIYLVRDMQGKMSKIILPVYGVGLWGMMYAFLALDSDGLTVAAISYYEHQETPGLGGEVENPTWRKQWHGKKLFDDQGEPALRIVKGGANKDDPYGIDALSGATMTSKGVQNTIHFWLGENGFGPFLKKVREGDVQNG